MKTLIRNLIKEENKVPNIKTFRIIKCSDGYIIASVSNGFAISEKYPTYPANVINVLKNIGYTQA